MACERAGCAEDARVAVEKPFGRDLASARALNRTLHEVFPESRDLPHRPLPRQGAGAEPALLPLRQRVPRAAAGTATTSSSVQITMAESFGVEGRGSFYEETGAIRDVVQNHLLADHSRSWRWTRPSGRTSRRSATRRRACSGRSRRSIPRTSCAGSTAGYRDEPGVAPDSTVETFAAVELRIDTWRWAGVPFFIRAGKRMPATVTEVDRRAHSGRRATSSASSVQCPNYFRFRLGPDVVDRARHARQAPGRATSGEVRGARRGAAGDHEDPATTMLPYERLLGDAMRGDPSLFARQDAIEAQWRVVDPVLGDARRSIRTSRARWGPAEADRLAPLGCRNPFAEARA